MEIFSQSLKRLRAFLDLEYKGLNVMPIVLKNQEFDTCFIKELSEISSWLQEHVEVKFVNFIFHIDNTSIPQFTNKSEYLIFRNESRKLFNQLNSLPQIVFMDMKGSFQNVWCEFLYHANLTIVYSSSIFKWNHLQKGIVPISKKTHQQPESLKNIILTSQDNTGIELANLLSTIKTYSKENERKKIINSIKRNILNSSPTGIIQLKHAFNSSSEVYEKIINATHLNSDWQNPDNFLSVHDMKKILNGNSELNEKIDTIN